MIATDLRLGGLVALGLLWIGTLLIGDKGFAWLIGKEDVPHLAKTAIVRPIVSILFSAWLEYVAFSLACQAYGGRTVVFVMIGWYSLAVLAAFYLNGYAYRPSFDGFTVHVKEPKTKKFGTMDYKINPNDLGDSVFSQMWFVQMSALLAPVELGIHMTMGTDANRVQAEEDLSVCQGMMAQELNHGKAQVLFSHAAETIQNYPAGYRRLWKLVLFDIFNRDLRQGFLGFLEAGFIGLNRLLAIYPPLLQHMTAEPRWIWAWHLAEEAEHCWDSVPDLIERTSLPARAIIWFVGSILLSNLAVFLCVLESFAYAKKALFRNPYVVVSSILIWMFVMPNIVMMVSVCNLLHLVFGLRPSDGAYNITYDQVEHKVFQEKHGHLFRVSHIQKPDEHLKVRNSVVLRSSTNSLRQSLLRFVGRESLGSSGILSPDGSSRILSPDDGDDTRSSKRMSAVQRLSNYRTQLYEETKVDLKTGGMKDAEIDDAGFGDGGDRASVSALSFRSSCYLNATNLSELQKMIEEEDAAEEKAEEESNRNNDGHKKTD